MRRSVLIVDDHDDFRASARALLEAEGFAVVGEAADGGSALEAVATLRPSVVLLDVQLPGIDGIEVAERLAETPEPPAVVLISALGLALTGGAAARLTVPVGEAGEASLLALQATLCVLASGLLAGLVSHSWVYFVVEPNREQLAEIARLADSGDLRPLVDSVFPLRDGLAAFDRVMEPGKRGKVVLRVVDG